MALIDSSSTAGTKSELDHFQIPPTQVAVEKTSWMEVNLQNPCTNNGPYEFVVSPDAKFLHLAKNYLFMEIRIVKADGIALQHGAQAANPDPLIGPINIIGKRFVKQMNMHLNGKPVYNSGDLYAYRAFLETELSYGRDAKECHLQAAMCSQDTPHNHIDDDQNTGLTGRASYFRQGRWVEVMAPLHCDLFEQSKYMVNNIKLHLTIYRNPDNFCILSPTAAENYKIEVRNMKWYVKAVEVSKAAAIGLERALRINTAKYPLRRVETKTMELHQGVFQSSNTPVFTGQIPRRMIFGCVDRAAFNGAYAQSPFNFNHFLANQVSVTATGQTFPLEPLQMNYDENKYTRAFIQLFEGLGISGDNKGNGVTLKKFKNGLCLYAFDLSPDEDDGNHWDLIKRGATHINMKFANAIPAGGVELIACAEFDNLLSIDYDRNVFTDYTP